MAVYNHWTGLDWTTGLPLKLKIKHHNSISGVYLHSDSNLMCNSMLSTSVFSLYSTSHD